MDYLKVIAAETHPIGSTANQKVRDYLVKELEGLGLETKVETGLVHLPYSGIYNRSAYVENVLATLPGSEPGGKKVALAAHYDSVFEGPGAADDGYAVAGMIETVKLLKDQPRKNDIQLIITDGEEMGLLGAQFHAKKYTMADIGILLNYEARGNEGPGISFEWSDNNAWMVREMKKASIRPIANSLSYEIYNRMPNSSDFTAFKKRKVPGINHAFIDGFSYYHNPADNVENISMESIQHTGENMYLMTKHFSNYDFSTEETGNASFFNFYGLLIHYPSSLDLVLLVLLAIIIIGLIILISKKMEFHWTRFFSSLAWMLFTIIGICALNFGLASILKSVYPQYATFYSHHYYNHEWYLIAGLGLTLFITAILSGRIIQAKSRTETGMAMLALLTLLSIAIFLTMPTGVYVMLLPALFLGICMIPITIAKNRNNFNWLLSLAFMILITGLWTVLTHNLYLAFSLGALPGAVLFIMLGSFASMYLMPEIWDNQGRKIFGVVGILLFVSSLIIAHIKTTPSEKEPLLTNLKYVYDAKDNATYRATFDDYLHKGHQNLKEEPTSKRLPWHLPYTTHYQSSGTNLANYLSQIKSDTVSLDYVCKVYNPKRAHIAYIKIPDTNNVDSLILNNRIKKDVSKNQRGNKYSLTLYGIGLDSLEVKIIPKDKTQQVSLYVNMEYEGLPEELPLPEGHAWNDATTYISHKIDFNN